MTPPPCEAVVSCGISRCFHLLSPCTGQIAHALLTRPPLEHFGASSSMSPLDLHVLGTPPAFVLSQDQTLMFNPSLPQSSAPTDSRFRCLSQKSDCSFLLLFLHYIVFKDRLPFALATTSDSISKLPPFVKHFFSGVFQFSLPIYIRIFCTIFAQFLSVNHA